MKRVWAVVPVKERSRAKERLAPVLGVEERAELAAAMLADVLAALSHSRHLAGVAVFSADGKALALARAWGVEGLVEQRPLGYSGAADEAARLADGRGYEALLVLPADIPLVSPRDVDDLVDALGEQPRGMAICPDGSQRGTNALLRRPATCLPAQFGPDSLRLHQAAAHQVSLPCKLVHNPNLALDVDTPEDLRHLLLRGGGPATRKALARFGVAQRLPHPAAVGAAR